MGQQRPRAGIVEIIVHLTHGFLSTEEDAQAQIDVRNAGPTRATKVTGWARVVIAPIDTKSFKTGGPDIKFDSDAIESTFDDNGTAAPDHAFSGDEMKSVKDKLGAVFVYGEIKYTDVLRFGTYTTKFRHFYTSNGTDLPGDGLLRLAPAKDGNDIQ